MLATSDEPFDLKSVKELRHPRVPGLVTERLAAQNSP
jgi:hypothetical protein